jgi:hypothetical protein
MAAFNERTRGHTLPLPQLARAVVRIGVPARLRNTQQRQLRLRAAIFNRLLLGAAVPPGLLIPSIKPIDGRNHSEEYERSTVASDWSTAERRSNNPLLERKEVVKSENKSIHDQRRICHVR